MDGRSPAYIRPVLPNKYRDAPPVTCTERRKLNPVVDVPPSRRQENLQSRSLYCLRCVPVGSRSILGHSLHSGDSSVSTQRRFLDTYPFTGRAALSLLPRIVYADPVFEPSPLCR